MDFLTAIKHIFITYVQDHIYIGVAIIIVLGILLIRKPRVFLLILFISLILTGVLYLISTLSITGASHKQRLIHEEEQLLNKDDLH
jgi:multisubunit Na+/H+ antiporter MnhC subunit